QLKSDLLELRPLAQSDYESLLKAASDPLIWSLHPQPDRYKPEVFIKFFAEALESKGALVIVDRKTLEVIGTTRYYDYSPGNASVVIGYTFLSRKYWGGVYNLDLKKLVVNYALGFVSKTYFHVGLDNKRSQKAMLKIGGVNTGVQEIPVSYAPPKKSYVYLIDKPL
ncbi:MAG: GNAT family N-acetyltransferase, partial [Bdellovibrionaceae bacterium]|nr:GNAT family N-acetyltransferase [Pseudobdellovibrionaceae bacterium]